ncbi:hypothetical protein BCR34DRAFT_599494 [Clohesyomyces aquaticus]|uniref:Uncharacterized protein n=1 Tax=Clohesyomyces aquaticus TaxID=1231657 RepID=A0A1Y1ZWE8_9PLEO|nr:hypothetical protein BCR34DRAFT_599494 [Clohesyomyces aquaticus]
MDKPTAVPRSVCKTYGLLYASSAQHQVYGRVGWGTHLALSYSQGSDEFFIDRWTRPVKQWVCLGSFMRKDVETFHSDYKARVRVLGSDLYWDFQFKEKEDMMDFAHNKLLPVVRVADFLQTRNDMIRAFRVAPNPPYGKQINRSNYRPSLARQDSDDLYGEPWGVVPNPTRDPSQSPWLPRTEPWSKELLESEAFVTAGIGQLRHIDELDKTGRGSPQQKIESLPSPVQQQTSQQSHPIIETLRSAIRQIGEGSFGNVAIETSPGQQSSKELEWSESSIQEGKQMNTSEQVEDSDVSSARFPQVAASAQPVCPPTFEGASWSPLNDAMEESVDHVVGTAPTEEESPQAAASTHSSPRTPSAEASEITTYEDKTGDPPEVHMMAGVPSSGSSQGLEPTRFNPELLSRIKLSQGSLAMSVHRESSEMDVFLDRPEAHEAEEHVPAVSSEQSPGKTSPSWTKPDLRPEYKAFRREPIEVGMIFGLGLGSARGPMYSPPFHRSRSEPESGVSSHSVIRNIRTSPLGENGNTAIESSTALKADEDVAISHSRQHSASASQRSSVVLNSAEAGALAYDMDFKSEMTTLPRTNRTTSRSLQPSLPSRSITSLSYRTAPETMDPRLSEDEQGPDVEVNSISQASQTSSFVFGNDTHVFAETDSCSSMSPTDLSPRELYDLIKSQASRISALEKGREERDLEFEDMKDELSSLRANVDAMGAQLNAQSGELSEGEDQK